jgi:hypothetical protein
MARCAFGDGYLRDEEGFIVASGTTIKDGAEYRWLLPASELGKALCRCSVQQVYAWVPAGLHWGAAFTPGITILVFHPGLSSAQCFCSLLLSDAASYTTRHLSPGGSSAFCAVTIQHVVSWQWASSVVKQLRSGAQACFHHVALYSSYTYLAPTAYLVCFMCNLQSCHLIEQRQNLDAIALLGTQTRPCSNSRLQYPNPCFQWYSTPGHPNGWSHAPQALNWNTGSMKDATDARMSSVDNTLSKESSRVARG